MGEEAQGNWVGNASVELNGVKPDQIWPFIADDFCNLHKWFPTIDDCSRAEGTDGEVGVIRRCVTKAFPPVDGGPLGTGYALEKLVKLDPVEHSLSYQALDNNLGVPVGGYEATWTVPETPGGCKIDWSFVSEPIVWMKLEDYCSFMEAQLKITAERMEAAAKAAAGKWVGKTSVEMSGVTADQIWLLVADFCNIQKFNPSLESSACVEGTEGEIGVVRCCTTKVFPSADGGANTTTYAKEKLVKLEPAERSLSYQVMENNVGLPAGGYLGTMKVSETTGGGCKLDWSFVSEPIHGWKLEDFCAIVDANLKTMGELMEAAAKASASA